ITHDLKGEKLVMIGVLKGAAIFLSDLARSIQADATFDFVAVSSYGKGQRSSGAVKGIKDLDQPIEGKNVLIVEDILDTGLTLAYLRKLFAQQHPKSLRIATLLDKPSRRIEKIDADYVGFSIPNLFVIGYGMDYAERYRNLPDISLMAPDHPESLGLRRIFSIQLLYREQAAETLLEPTSCIRAQAAERLLELRSG